MSHIFYNPQSVRRKVSKTDRDNTQTVVLSYKFYIKIKLKRINICSINYEYGIKLQYMEVLNCLKNQQYD